MKIVKAKHKAVFDPIADLITYRAMPTDHIPMNTLDPFIFLNHHGWQKYPEKNNGLPFGPHPHRGFETVTFILEGDLVHMDNSGGSSVIKAGGIQWMTAGKGLIHAEMSSDEFKEKGGSLEILQLWINLPAKFKMTEPTYVGLQKEEIPVVEWDDGKVKAHVVSGTWNGVTGPVKPLTDIHIAKIDFSLNGKLNLTIDAFKTIFLYVVRGSLKINGEVVEMHDLIQFSHEGTMIEVKAITDAVILLGHATPFKEPFYAYGPFVMNTQEEVMQAYEDYNKGLLGNIKAFSL